MTFNIPDNCEWIKIPMYGLILVETYITVPNLKHPVPVSLVYDTGASGISLSQSFFDTYGFTAIGKDTSLTSDGAKEVNQYEIKEFHLHGENFGDVIANSCKIYGLDDLEESGLKEQDHPGYVGLIGLRYIKGFDTLMSFEEHKKIFCVPRKGYIEGIHNSKQDRSELARDLLHFAARGQIYLPN